MWHEPLEPFVALGIPLGLLLCFAGYRLMRGLLAATGFLVGGVLAIALSQALSGGGLWAMAAGVLGGFIGAALLALFFRLGVFVLGAAAGALLGHSLIGAVAGIPPLGIAAATGMVCGVLALGLRRLLLVGFTAVLGAWLSVGGVLHFSAGVDLFSEGGAWRQLPTRTGTWATVGWLLLSVSGAFFQWARRPGR